MSQKRENDRRGKWRFEMEREVRYKLLDDGSIVASGSGQTTDISSSGVKFLGEQSLTPGAFVELSISWPVLLHDTCPMRLIVYGRVIRNDNFSSACSIDKYEFRTQSRAAREAPTPLIRNDGPLRRWVENMRAKPLEQRASA